MGSTIPPCAFNLRANSKGVSYPLLPGFGGRAIHSNKLCPNLPSIGLPLLTNGTKRNSIEKALNEIRFFEAIRRSSCSDAGNVVSFSGLVVNGALEVDALRRNSFINAEMPK